MKGMGNANDMGGETGRETDESWPHTPQMRAKLARAEAEHPPQETDLEELEGRLLADKRATTT